MLDPTRAYASYQELVEKESRLPAGERVDFVAVTTPNDSHFPIAKLFLESGFHVMCEKPMTFTVTGSTRTCCDRPEDREGVRIDAQLYRLSHGQTCARHGPAG